MPLCLWFLLLSDFSFQCCVIFVSTFILYLCKMFIFRNVLFFPPPPASAFLFRFNCIFMFVFGIYILMGEVFPTGNQLWHFREWLKNYFSVCCEKFFFFARIVFFSWSVFSLFTLEPKERFRRRCNSKINHWYSGIISNYHSAFYTHIYRHESHAKFSFSPLPSDVVVAVFFPTSSVHAVAAFIWLVHIAESEKLQRHQSQQQQ